MIEGVLMRATNRTDARERVAVGAIAGNVDAARADLLLVLVNTLLHDSASPRMAIAGLFAPQLRDRLKRLVDEQTEEMAGALVELTESHQLAVIDEWKMAGVALEIGATPVTAAERLELMSREIEAKNFRAWVAQSTSQRGSGILSACEIALGDGRPLHALVRFVADSISREMSNLRISHEKCLRAFHAENLRSNESAFTDAFKEAAVGLRS